jgi:hypothetical protein
MRTERCACVGKKESASLTPAEEAAAVASAAQLPREVAVRAGAAARCPELQQAGAAWAAEEEEDR